jgi:hypothetical protein
VILPGTASCRKKGAPSTSRPATPPRSQSSAAPSAALYHRTAACASGTISITERDVGGVAPFIAPASYVASDHLLPRSRACSERHPFAQLRASRRTIAHARSGRKRSSARVDQARFCSSILASLSDRHHGARKGDANSESKRDGRAAVTLPRPRSSTPADANACDVYVELEA